VLLEGGRRGRRYWGRRGFGRLLLRDEVRRRGGLRERVSPLVRLAVQPVVVDVVDDDGRDEVLDAHALADKEADLCRRDVVPDRLLDHVDVVPVEGERGPRVDGRRGKDGLVEFRLGPLDDVAAVDAENVVELGGGGGGGGCGLGVSKGIPPKSKTAWCAQAYILFCPYAGFRHGEDEVGPCEEHDADALLDDAHVAGGGVADAAVCAAAEGVQLVVKVVEDLGGREVAGLPRLPRVDHEPVARVVYGGVAHGDAVGGRGEAEFGVAVVDGAQVASDDAELRVEVGVVAGHLEQAEVQKGDGRVAPARDEHERRLVDIRAVERAESLRRELVVALHLSRCGGSISRAVVEFGRVRSAAISGGASLGRGLGAGLEWATGKRVARLSATLGQQPCNVVLLTRVAECECGPPTRGEARAQTP
jgi:hypothetical protein